jgi:hypothetical protein
MPATTITGITFTRTPHGVPWKALFSLHTRGFQE